MQNVANSNSDTIRQIQGNARQIKTNSNKFKQIRTNLRKFKQFKQIQANVKAIKFKKIHANNFVTFDNFSF